MRDEATRIEPDDLWPRIAAGAVSILDVRRAEAWRASSQRIPGALRVAPESLAEFAAELAVMPRRPIVTYCCCPAEATSAAAALYFESLGLDASALRGGFDGWIGAGYPTELRDADAKAA